MKKTIFIFAIIALMTLTACNSGALKELQASYDQAIEENDSLKQDKTTLEAEVKGQKDSIKALSQEIDTYKEEISENGVRIKSLETDMAALEQQAEDLQSKVSQYESAALDNARSTLIGIMNNLSMCEYYPQEDLKVLQISIIVRNENDIEGSEKLGETVALMSQKTWFDYDYIYMDVILETGERLSSVCLNPYDFSVQLAEYAAQ